MKATPGSANSETDRDRGESERDYLFPLVSLGLKGHQHNGHMID